MGAADGKMAVVDTLAPKRQSNDAAGFRHAGVTVVLLITLRKKLGK
jgi:hypothetical protein